MNNQLSYPTTQLLFQDLGLLPHLWATLPHHHPHVTRKSDFFCGICVALWPQDDTTSLATDVLMLCKFQLIRHGAQGAGYQCAKILLFVRWRSIL